MTMKKVLGLGLIALAVMGTSECVLAALATPESIIVMPARKRIVHLAFQIARCKDVGLVAYNTSPTLAAPLIHVWNGQEWVQITLEDFQQGAFMSGEPRQVFIMGDNSVLPAQLGATPEWAKNAQRIATLDTAGLINLFGKALKFSPRQWEWMAEVNGLSIKDTNAERRKYGRWGAPGKEADLSPVKLDSCELPPCPAMVSCPKTIEDKVILKPEPATPATKAEIKAEVKVEAVEAKDEVKAEAPKGAAVKSEETPKVEYKLEQKPVAPPVPPVVEKPATLVEKPAVPPLPAANPIDPTSK